jgi:retron-type reverse transcriptase
MPSFTHDIKAAKNHGLVTSILTFDFQGYFNNIPHSKLLSLLYHKQFPLPLIKWVAHFVTEQKMSVCLNSTCNKMSPVDAGLPQGSPISPGLSSIFSSTLNERIDVWAIQYQHDHPNFHVTQLSPIIFIDDGKFYVSLDSFKVTI